MTEATAITAAITAATTAIVAGDLADRVARRAAAVEDADRSAKVATLRRQQTDNARLFKVMADDYRSRSAETGHAVLRTTAKALHGYAVALWQAAQDEIEFASDVHRLMVRGQCMNAAFGIPAVALDLMEEAEHAAY